MATALVTGITGQDGHYLTEWLLSKGYSVVGTTRSLSRAHGQIDSVFDGKVEVAEWDMQDEHALVALIRKCRPQEIYNLGAFSSGSAMYDDPAAICEINGLAVTRILEAIRTVDPAIHFCQASSSEMFGEAAESPQTEQTRFQPRSPYGAAKLYAHEMVRIYRQRYGIFGCSAILFNHESPKRSVEFVTRKVTRAAAAIKLGMQKELLLGNLEAERDWGFAGDYTRAMWQMLRANKADDYIVATGIPHSVRILCQYAFSRVGLNYRDYIREDPTSLRPCEAKPLVGTPAKLMHNLQWCPTVSFEKLVKMMVDADINEMASANKH